MSTDMKYKPWLLIIVSTILLTSCKPKLSLNFDTQNDRNIESHFEDNEIRIEDIVKGRKLLAVGTINEILLLDPEFAKPLSVYTFSQDDEPTSKYIDTFTVSPNNRWIVWYTPMKGVLAYNVLSEELKVVHEATDFLNRYPYVEFLDQDILVFIIEDGNSLAKHSLTNDERSLINIPYPYGNVFKISPDNKSILYVSGYGQSKTKPKFMYTDYTGNFSQQFFTETNLFDRNQVFWAPDSSGVLMINSNSLEFYSLINPSSAQVMFSLNKEMEIEKASRIENSIFVLDKKGYWHVYDYNTRKEIARTPDGIAAELNNPEFIPWTQSEFIIEETLIDGDIEFNRLWISDFRGNKKILVPRYNDLIIKTKLENLE